MAPASSSILKAILPCLILFTLFNPSLALGQTGERILNVEQMIEEAGQNNPEILAAKQKWEAFKDRVPQALALPDPMLGFGIVNLPTNFSFRDEDMTMKEISVTQMFPFYGKRKLMGEMAEKEAESVYTEIQERVNRVIRDVKTTYYDLSHVYRTTEVVEKNKRILEDFAKVAEIRYTVGEGIQQDMLKAHVEVSKMVDELIMLNQRRRSLEAKLDALLDRPPGSTVGKPEEVSFREISHTVADLQEMAEEINPVLQGMKKMIEAKEKAFDLAKREYYPDFTFKFAYGQRDSVPDMRRRDMLTGMVELNIPIFYKSKQGRKLAEAKADIINWEAQYRGMKNEILFMVADMASMIRQRERQHELYSTEIIPLAELQVNSAMSAYRVGKVDFLTPLESQMSLYRYEIEYHQTITEYEKSVANLEAAVGKPLIGQ
jgi:cobalt-zinc-cadmium efflux system outer membrane protein